MHNASEEKLLECFGNQKKRRLLNILFNFEMVQDDLFLATRINRGTIGVCLKKFLEAGLIVKRKVPDDRRVIYMRWFLDRKIMGYDDVAPAIVIKTSNIVDSV